MANTVITSTTNSIKVAFNDQANLSLYTDGAYKKSSINSIRLFDDHIKVVTNNSESWVVSNQTNTIKAIVIDTVDGVAPSSLSDLYDKLATLIA